MTEVLRLLIGWLKWQFVNFESYSNQSSVPESNQVHAILRKSLVGPLFRLMKTSKAVTMPIDQTWRNTPCSNKQGTNAQAIIMLSVGTRNECCIKKTCNKSSYMSPYLGCKTAAITQAEDPFRGIPLQLLKVSLNEKADLSAWKHVCTFHTTHSDISMGLTN